MPETYQHQCTPLNELAKAPLVEAFTSRSMDKSPVENVGQLLGRSQTGTGHGPVDGSRSRTALVFWASKICQIDITLSNEQQSCNPI